MSRNNTGNPIDSKAFPDFEDNVKNLDLAVNSDELRWSDRFGRDRKSFEGMEREFDADQAARDNAFESAQTYRENEFDSAQAYRESRFNDFIASSGYQFLGDYGPGIEFTEYNQLVRDENGEFWRLSGQVELPYTTTGAGIPEDDALAPAGDAVLRQDLASPDKGAAMVARGVVAVDGLKGLASIPPGLRRADLRYENDGFYAGSAVGGGAWKWKADEPKSNHNGGTVVDPDRVNAWDGTQSDLSTLFETAESGSGCFVRLFAGKYFHSDMVGLLDDDWASDQYPAFLAWSECVRAIGDGGEYFLSGGFLANMQSRVSINGRFSKFISNGKDIRLPFTQEFADTDPGGAVGIFSTGSDYYNFNFDGYRASNGVGTSPTVPSPGQGAIVNLAGGVSAAHNVKFHNCKFHGSVYPNIVNFGATGVKFFDCHFYDAGEHNLYLSGGAVDFLFERCRFGNCGMNPDQGQRLTQDVKYRPDISGAVKNVRYVNCIVEQPDPPATGQVCFNRFQGGDDTTDILYDGIEVFNPENIYAFVYGIQMLEGDLLDGIKFKNIKNAPLLLGNPVWSLLSGGKRFIGRIEADNVHTLGGLSLTWFTRVSNVRAENTVFIGDVDNNDDIHQFFDFLDKKLDVNNIELNAADNQNRSIRIHYPLSKEVDICGLRILADQSASAPQHGRLRFQRVGGLTDDQYNIVNIRNFDIIQEDSAQDSISFDTPQGLSESDITVNFMDGKIRNRVSFRDANVSVTFNGVDYTSDLEFSYKDFLLVTPPKLIQSFNCLGKLGVSGVTTIPSGQTQSPTYSGPRLAVPADYLYGSASEFTLGTVPSGKPIAMRVNQSSNLRALIDSAHTDDIKVRFNVGIYKTNTP